MNQMKVLHFNHINNTINQESNEPNEPNESNKPNEPMNLTDVFFLNLNYQINQMKQMIQIKVFILTK